LASLGRTSSKIAFLLANLRLKLLAIAFAVALWSVVAYAQNPTQIRTYHIPIDHPTLPAGLVVVGDVPQVAVSVVGTANDLAHFDKSMLHATGNFVNVKVGANRVPISVQNSDPNVNIDAPNSVQVTVDELASVSEAVSIERIHALLPGFHEQTSATTVTPASVKVDGPKSQLTGIQAVVQVDLASVTAAGFNTPIPVVIRDANKVVLTKSITVTPPQVTVKMVIQADAITVAKPVGFTLTGQPAAGYRVTNVQIAPLEVQATGLQNVLTAINLLATDPVDVSGAKGDVVKTVTIRPPAGVDVNQKTAQVHVFISPAPGVSASP
jgi:YbbR domain-containing protein